MLDASVKVGVKRKLDESGGGCSSGVWDESYHQQRQAILNVSMHKLQSFTTSRVEQSLLRSVLIYNTLKYIEQELTNEGITIPASMAPPSFHQDTLESIPPSTDSAQDGLQKLDIRSSPRPDRSYHSITPYTSSKLSLSTTHLTRDVINTGRHSNGWWSEPAIVCAPPAEKSAKFSHNVNAQLDINCNSTSSTPILRRDVTSDVRTSALSGKSDDDLFGDIDIDFALYDLDLFSPVPPKLPPISADELLHVIPGASSAENFSSYTAPSSGASCKTEVICDDLDHIMQVLVGM